MISVKVTNEGKRTRERIGVQFRPGESHEMTVSHRDRVALRAVRGFKVQDLESGEVSREPVPEATTPKEEPEEHTEETRDDEYDPSEHTVREVLNSVDSGEVSAEDALNQELEGKARNTLVDQLREKVE